VLVFLPGWREIHRLEALLLQRTLPPDTVVRVLHGDTPPEMQREALAAAAPGVRKIILSTNVAETSLTIDGVRVVVDAGLARVPRFDPRRGMTGLVTVPVSRASADQRRGRAGRQAPGVCYRLWAERHHEERAPHSQPEMAAADLAPFVLELALWGDPLGHHLRFLDPPPPANLERARNLLKDLGAMDTENNLTSHGRSMATIPLHPRLSHMLLRAIGLGLGGPACDVAALLEERDILTERSDVDLGSRYRALRTGAGADRTIRSRVLAEADRLRSVTRCKQGHTGESALGILLALAYPERIACRREGRDGRLLTAGGTGAVLPERSLLRRERFLALGDVDATGTEARVFLASPLREEDLRKEFAGSIRAEEEAVWDDRTESVVARRVERLGAIVLAERPLPKGDKRIQEAMADGIQRMGLAALPWSEEADSIRTRSEWLRRRELAPREWPDLSDGALLENLHEWLGPHLGGRTRREDLQGLRLAGILRARFTHHQRGELDRLAPASLVAPTGSRITLVYTVDGPPVLAVKLQEMFGQTDTPLVAGGKVSVLVHMLSPAGRPLAVTQDLRSFWTNTYPDVRNQMRGRYPKHPWPEDPLAAVPTRGVRRRRTAGG
jgi:ATP-dependent helicase HrpB